MYLPRGVLYSETKMVELDNKFAKTCWLPSMHVFACRELVAALACLSTLVMAYIVGNHYGLQQIIDNLADEANCKIFCNFTLQRSLLVVACSALSESILGCTYILTINFTCLQLQLVVAGWDIQ